MGSNIRKRIRAIREQKGLRAIDVANGIRLSRPYYTQLEGGTRRLSAEHVQKIARVLGVSVLDLYEGKGRVGGRGERQKRDREPKHVRPVNSKELRKRLSPLLGEQTEDAIQCIEMLVLSPTDAKRKIEAFKRQIAQPERQCGRAREDERQSRLARGRA